MEPNPMKTAMIRSAVNVGIQAIRETPGRGIRNLVELGDMFAGGRFQKSFFSMAMQHLEDEDGAYTKLAQQMVCSANQDILCTFGTNLGYNALSHGAKIIRSIEKKEGFNVPWCFYINTGQDGAWMPPDKMEGIVAQGKEMGVYSYLLRIDERYPDVDGILSVFAKHKDVACVLYVHPQMVDHGFCRGLCEAKNICCILDMDHSDREMLCRALENLKGCLYGGYKVCPDLQPGDVNGEMLQECEALGIPVLVIVRPQNHESPQEDDVYRKFVSLREGLEVPVLPIDLLQDVFHADRAISGEACFAAVESNGDVVLTNVDADQKAKGYNVFDTPLREILRSSLPKTMVE